MPDGPVSEVSVIHPGRDGQLLAEHPCRAIQEKFTMQNKHLSANKTKSPMARSVAPDSSGVCASPTRTHARWVVDAILFAKRGSYGEIWQSYE
jgi:hypothetical protein